MITAAAKTAGNAGFRLPPIGGPEMNQLDENLRSTSDARHAHQVALAHDLKNLACPTRPMPNHSEGSVAIRAGHRRLQAAAVEKASRTSAVGQGPSRNAALVHHPPQFRAAGLSSRRTASRNRASGAEAAPIIIGSHRRQRTSPRSVHEALREGNASGSRSTVARDVGDLRPASSEYSREVSSAVATTPALESRRLTSIRSVA